MGRAGVSALAAAVVACAAWCNGVAAQSAPAGSAPSAQAATLFDLVFGGPPADMNRPGDAARLDPDRPHLPEASTTVGVGRVVLEAGYTFSRKDSSFTQSYPEALLRVGLLAGWFEVRAGQNFVVERRSVGGSATSASGAQDFYLGAKLAVSAQHGVLPAMTLIPQMTVPAGSVAETAGRVLPGLNADFSWELIENRFGIELLVANNRVRDDFGAHHELATGLTGVIQLTRILEAFAEWDAFYPIDGIGAKGRATTRSAASSISSRPTWRWISAPEPASMDAPTTSSPASALRSAVEPAVAAHLGFGTRADVGRDLADLRRDRRDLRADRRDIRRDRLDLFFDRRGY